MGAKSNSQTISMIFSTKIFLLLFVDTASNFTFLNA